MCEGVHLPDPRCVLDGDWKDDLSQLPKVTFPDIFVYLINLLTKISKRNTCYRATTHMPPSTPSWGFLFRAVFTAPSAVSRQSDFPLISNQRRAISLIAQR